MWYLFGAIISFAIMYIYIIARQHIDTDDMDELVPGTLIVIIAATIWPIIFPAAAITITCYHIGMWLRETINRKYHQ
jgi:hypothetical protein